MEITSKLQQIGLSGREAEVYVALLQKSEFTAPELSKITTITRTKIYDILQNLVRKGVCNESYKNGLKVYRGIKPQIAFQNIISNYELEIEKKKKTAVDQRKEVAATLENELSVLHETSLNNDESLDYIEVLTDKGQIKERWLKIQRNVKNELLAFTKPPYTGKLGDNVEEETTLLKNNLTIKGIYEYKGLSQEEIKNLITIIETYQKAGEQAKVIEELPMKLVISDDTITMFALNDKISLAPSITTIIVDHPSFAGALRNVFESYWSKAMSLDEFKNMIKN